MGGREVELIRRVAPLHDVGKIAIPDSILLWPGPLEPGQIEVMKTHTIIGGDLLGGSGFELLDRAAEIALSHHEHWNGQGYPYGLAGETMLNFGPLTVPLAYGLFGLFVGGLRRWASGLGPGDARILMLLFVVSLTLFFLVWDSDVTLYYVITTGLVPLLLLAVSSSRSSVGAARSAIADPNPVAFPAYGAISTSAS